MIGQTVSHYKILEKLGEGGMGIDYRAQDTKLNREVALKFLPPYLASEAGQKERFFQEARAASALNHPNVTTIHEIDEHYDQIFIAMELVEGKTLKQIVKAETFPVKKVLDIAIQVCEGLTAAAEKGIVHRDIKSDNIILTPKMQVKIMDFGLAKFKGAEKLTKTGSTVGTAAYMSPEQASGEEVDHRADIFSFGVVLYELLTSHLPFRGEHPSGYIYSILNEEPPPLARYNDKVSAELQGFVSKTLAKDRAERYQHIDDLGADLRRERKNLEYAKSSTVPKAEGVHQPKKNFLKVLVPTSAIAVLALLFFLFNPFKVEVSRDHSAAASQNTLAVMYFENLPDPEDKDHTGEMLTNLLITALFQTKGLEVISRERLYDIQKELGQAESKTISPSLATQIAQRAGVSMMLLGSILQQQPSLTVTFRLIEVKSGKILSTQRLTGFSAAQVFPLVDSLTTLVQRDLKITPSSASEKKSVAEVTTSSPEAYRSYLEGIELRKKAYHAEAEAAFKNAVELDSGFAMGYFRLFLSDFGFGTGSRKALQKAWQLKSKVTEPERLQIEAAYAGRINNDASGQAKILEQLLQKYPHEQMVYERLAILYQNIFEYDKALQTLQRGLKNDSLDKNLWNALAYLQAGWNRKAEALASIDRYAKLAPAEPNPYDSKGDIYYLFGDLDSAEYWFQKAISLRGDFWSLPKLADLALFRQDYDRAGQYYRKSAISSEKWNKWLSETGSSFIYMHRGRYIQAKKQLLDILSARRTLESEEAIWSYPYLINLAYETGDYPAMLQYARALSNEFRKDPDDIGYGRDFLAWAQLKNGHPKQGYKLLQEALRDVKVKDLSYQVGENYMLALLAYEEGKYDLAVELFKKAFQAALPNRGPQYQYALSLLKTDKLSEAIEELSRLTRYPYYSGDHMRPFDLSRSPTWNYWPIASVKAHFWLGVAYEQQGNKAKAKEEYEKFLEIWKDADTEVPELVDARKRLAHPTPNPSP